MNSRAGCGCQAGVLFRGCGHGVNAGAYGGCIPKITQDLLGGLCGCSQRPLRFRLLIGLSADVKSLNRGTHGEMLAEGAEKPTLFESELAVRIPSLIK